MAVEKEGGREGGRDKGRGAMNSCPLYWPALSPSLLPSLPPSLTRKYLLHDLHVTRQLRRESYSENERGREVGGEE